MYADNDNFIYLSLSVVFVGAALHMAKCTLIIFTVALLLQGCVSDTDPLKDAWQNESPTPILLSKPAKIPDTDVYKVVSYREPSAEILLSQKSAIPISISSARSFLNLSVKRSDAKKPYLVRAIYASEGAGNFNVYAQKGSLWVIHQSVGVRVGQFKRQALVVFLKDEPKKVFVQWSMVQ